jgi:hypothetical protein
MAAIGPYNHLLHHAKTLLSITSFFIIITTEMIWNKYQPFD